MSSVAIRVENLGKLYRLGTREPYYTLRDAIARGFKAGLGYFWNGRRGSDAAPGDILWALKEVSFEIKQGEVVGIIGRNGAGKSTLLKILSRITEPTEGYAELSGRVGSLLEVGTGFHPELTGRENVYLNGAVLGMKKREIDRKFDEIVAFAEVEKFIDTPVKHYSSGMYVRLAFAVAAHLEPEIFLLDEVLAVGDAAFQRKCRGKIGEVAREGRTVIFVSHNMVSIEQLCERVIVLNNGQIRCQANPRHAIQAYLDSLRTEGTVTKTGTGEFDLTRAPRGGSLTQAGMNAFKSLSIHDSTGHPRDVVCSGEDIVFIIRYRLDFLLKSPTVGIVFSHDSYGRLAFAQTRLQYGEIEWLPPEGELRCTIPRIPFAPGRYTLSLGLSSSGKQFDWIEDQIELNIEPADFFGTGCLPLPTHGPFLLDACWHLPGGKNAQ